MAGLRQWSLPLSGWTVAELVQSEFAIVPTQGNAQALPYPDAIFDGAYLVATLGEVPDKDATLSELHRVVRPGGRLAVGEGQPDPHLVRFPVLRDRAMAAGFDFEQRVGSQLGYVARFRKT
ncbi:MAG: methyltransferase domain-containing protein [Chloroflexi bacterium]|nr:methyltransferase domain-containing protein [Chloroflexota bacterium]